MTQTCTPHSTGSEGGTTVLIPPLEGVTMAESDRRSRPDQREPLTPAIAALVTAAQTARTIAARRCSPVVGGQDLNCKDVCTV